VLAYAKPRKTRSGETRSAIVRPAREAASTRKSTLPRLAVSPAEAAEMLGVSRDYFDEHVIADLRIVRRGRRILVAVSELERWLARSSARGRLT
jgi:excisionase family DNA binding protein